MADVNQSGATSIRIRIRIRIEVAPDDVVVVGLHRTGGGLWHEKAQEALHSWFAAIEMTIACCRSRFALLLRARACVCHLI